jgi:hypothetical protein
MNNRKLNSGFWKYLFTCFAFFAFFILACAPNENEALILGEWVCTSWTSAVNPSNRCNNNVYFNFTEDKNFNSEITTLKEEGTYYLRKDVLYTQAEGRAEIAVRILKVNTDTLHFEMNRGGVEEDLILVRK